MNTRYFLSLFLVVFAGLLLVSAAYAQQYPVSQQWKERAEKLRQKYRHGLQQRNQNLQELADSLRQVHRMRWQATKRRARRYGIPFTVELASGYTAVLVYVDEDGDPRYMKPVARPGFSEEAAARVSNKQAAQVINTYELHNQPWSLLGQDQLIGMWEIEGAPRKDHQEFDGLGVQNELKWAPNDNLQYHPSTEATRNNDNHATHVSGTMIAHGVKNFAEGMAPQGAVRAYDAAGDLEGPNNEGEMAEATSSSTSPIKLSNHSYGPGEVGWHKLANGNWQWSNDADCNDPDCSEEVMSFGYYGLNGQANTVDDITYEAPYYLVVVAAGNDRDEGPSDPVGTGHPNDCAHDGGYDCIVGMALGKNVLTVGNIEDDGTTLYETSSAGPTDDGRIKPDVVARGYEVKSPIAYDNSGSPCTQGNDCYEKKTGTSMAAPSVTGSIALLRQQAQKAGDANAEGFVFRSATYKALVIGTANDLTSGDAKVGPDYRTGWGRMNTLKAAQVIRNEQEHDANVDPGPLHIWEESLDLSGSEPDTNSFKFSTDGSDVTVTLAWTDPAGSAPYPEELDPREKMLENDLDLRVYNENTGNMLEPWVLARRRKTGQLRYDRRQYNR